MTRAQHRTKTPARPRSRADLGEDFTMADLRRAWGEQDGMRLLYSERCRRRGRREEWELWRFTPARPPRRGPRCSYIVVRWWRDCWDSNGPYYSRAEAAMYLRLRGTVPGEIIPPLLESGRP